MKEGGEGKEEEAKELRKRRSGEVTVGWVSGLHMEGEREE